MVNQWLQELNDITVYINICWFGIWAMYFRFLWLPYLHACHRPHNIFFQACTQRAASKLNPRPLPNIFFVCRKKAFQFKARGCREWKNWLNWNEWFQSKRRHRKHLMNVFFSMRPTGAAHSQASMHQRRGLSRRVLCSGVVLRRTNYSLVCENTIIFWIMGASTNKTQIFTWMPMPDIYG